MKTTQTTSINDKTKFMNFNDSSLTQLSNVIYDILSEHIMKIFKELNKLEYFSGRENFNTPDKSELISLCEKIGLNKEELRKKLRQSKVSKEWISYFFEG